MHHVVRADDIQLSAEYEANSQSYTRCSMIDASVGSVHTGMGLCAIEAAGGLDIHVHSYEEGYYVIEGEPVLVLEGTAIRLDPGCCGVVPVGVPHAWLGPATGVARWIDVQAPVARSENPQDTFFLGPVGAPEITDFDLRDPRCRTMFRMVDSDLDLDSLRVGARVDAPAVSASMASALLAYSGIAVKMLVDERLDAQLFTMFMVEYKGAGIAHPHDHPLEESYYMLEGEVEAVADDVRYTLEAGDCLWTGVGCVHAFYNTSGRPVRWLETQSPQPPARHAYRFNRDWQYLAEKLGN